MSYAFLFLTHIFTTSTISFLFSSFGGRKTPRAREAVLKIVFLKTKVLMMKRKMSVKDLSGIQMMEAGGRDFGN